MEEEKIYILDMYPSICIIKYLKYQELWSEAKSAIICD